MRRLIAALCVVGCCVLSPAQAQRFRLTDLDLRDPHVWVSIIGCNDVTDVSGGLNAQIQANYQGDADGDGYLDASTVLEFLPLDQSAGTNLFDAGAANCTAPAASTRCDAVATPLLAGDATLQSTGTCSQPVAGTVVHVYTPAIATPTAQCFRSVTGTLTLNVSGIPITLSDAQIAAKFDGTPATSLSSGLMRGFLSETDANNTIIPATFPLIGGRPLASVLAGGTGACNPGFSDKDVGPGGVPGWYFYLNFPAQRLADDTFANGFTDGFE